MPCSVLPHPTSSWQVMYTRRDVFRRLNISVPQTWDKLVSVVAQLNATDWDPSVQGRKVPLCFVRPQPGDMGRRQVGSYLLGAILLSMVQLKGMQHGTLFDPRNMRPLARGPVLERALRLYYHLARFFPPDEQSIPLRTMDIAPYHLQAGRCAIALRWSGEAVQ